MAFIGVIEATLAYRVTTLKGMPQMIFVWFMVTFPAFVLIGFFYVQINNPLSWYPPSEIAKAKIEQLDYLDVKGLSKQNLLATNQRLKSTLALLQETNDLSKIKKIASDTFSDLSNIKRLNTWIDENPNHNLKKLQLWISTNSKTPELLAPFFIHAQGYEKEHKKVLTELQIP